MSTLTQKLLQKQPNKIFKWKRRALGGAPHKAGKCEKVFTRTPKKPCSARRAVTYVTLRNGNYVLCKLPGETHKSYNKLAQFSQVLVRGGRTLDIPGSKYKLAWTKKSRCSSLRPLEWKRRARSKFGVINTDREKRLRLIRGVKNLKK